MTLTLRTTLALSLFAATPALAQPAPKQPAPAKLPAPKQAAPAAAVDDMASFDKDLDALFAPGGLTAAQAAARAAGASPTVRRRVADLDVQVALKETTDLALVPQVSGKLSYTRLSFVAPFTLMLPNLPPDRDRAVAAELLSGRGPAGGPALRLPASVSQAARDLAAHRRLGPAQQAGGRSCRQGRTRGRLITSGSGRSCRS